MSFFLLIGDRLEGIANDLISADYQVEHQNNCNYMSAMVSLRKFGSPEKVTLVIWDSGEAAKGLAKKLADNVPWPILVSEHPDDTLEDEVQVIEWPIDAAWLIEAAVVREEWLSGAEPEPSPNDLFEIQDSEIVEPLEVEEPGESTPPEIVEVEEEKQPPAPQPPAAPQPTFEPQPAPAPQPTFEPQPAPAPPQPAPIFEPQPQPPAPQPPAAPAAPTPTWMQPTPTPVNTIKEAQADWGVHHTDSQFGSVTSDPNFGASPWINQLEENEDGPRGTVITIAAAKGGAGKSTLTLWLAQTLHAHNRKTAVVDANIGQADISKMLGLKVYEKAVGLPHLIAASRKTRFTDQQLQEACIAVPEIGTLLAGPRSPMEHDIQACQAALNLAINRLARTHEFVLIDSPVATVYESIFHSLLIARSSKQQAPLTDLICLVLNPHNTTAHDTVQYLQALTAPIALGGSNYPIEQVVAILNKADPSSSLNMDNLKKLMADMQVNLVTEIPQISNVIEASNQGRWQYPVAAKNGLDTFISQVCNVGEIVTAENTGKKKPRKGLLNKLRR